MALIRKFEPLSLQRNSLHDEIEARYAILEQDGKALVQINTVGRKTREMPGKTSQSLQLDRQSGKQLYDILKKAFQFD
ncbi:hypothetical protein [Cucumibacter marinus]|uniref:hypothetical protein n=1 Tax=Cucumibacter marinus TaxID=1121252 RepID=UPI000491583F|nr:hypothetical protein [Cucumibacter marinus]